jgi:hypothetical protein
MLWFLSFRLVVVVVLYSRIKNSGNNSLWIISILKRKTQMQWTYYLTCNDLHSL